MSLTKRYDVLYGIKILQYLLQSQRPPHLMPPPYLVDIDGHPHPLKGQAGILELIQPPSKNLHHDKSKEEVDVLEDYDEFMKQRQVQLASKSKQLAKVDVKRFLKTSESNHVCQNNRDTLYDDQPCCSSSQLFSQSQDSNVTMETEPTDNDKTIHNGKTEEVNGNSKTSKPLSNGDINSVQTAENGCQGGDDITNGHLVAANTNETTTVDHQSDKSFIDFDKNDQLNGQTVINSQKLVNGHPDFVTNQQVNDQARISDQSLSIDQAVNDQEITDQARISNQLPSIDHEVNDQQASNDEINIIEFDNSDEPAGGNNNILTSIVWSCGLSDQEAKDAVSLWMSRTVIPHLDTESYG